MVCDPVSAGLFPQRTSEERGSVLRIVMMMRRRAEMGPPCGDPCGDAMVDVSVSCGFDSSVDGFECSGKDERGMGEWEY